MKHEDYVNQYPNSRVLIIGGGPSTNKLESHRGRLHDYWDVVIVLNAAITLYEPEADFHLLLEDHPREFLTKLSKGKVCPKLPRLISELSVPRWPEGLNLIPTLRQHLENLQPRIWTGALTMSVGSERNDSSVALQALHWAGLLGATEIYLIGIELRWREHFQSHFYSDRNAYIDRANFQSHFFTNKNAYKDKEKLYFPTEGNMHFIVKLPDGWETITPFAQTASFIDIAVETIYEPAGIKVYDLSKGLITKARKIKLRSVTKRGKKRL